MQFLILLLQQYFVLMIY